MKKILFSTLMLTASITTSLTFAATVATVNGVNIDDAIIKKNIAQIPKQFLKGREAEIKKTLLTKMVEQEILLQEAAKLKIHESKEFKDQMKAVKDNLLSNLLVKKMVTDIVTEEAVKKAFETNKERFTAPGVKASHILLATEKEAKEVIKMLGKGGVFAEIAKKKSKGPSAKQGGDLGWFTANDMVKPFADVAFALAKGNYSKKPVKTKFGWHVILVEDVNPKMAPKFDIVKAQIQKQMQEKTVADYLAQLKASAKIEYTN